VEGALSPNNRGGGKSGWYYIDSVEGQDANSIMRVSIIRVSIIRTGK
jgi:hypothetical protein